MEKKELTREDLYPTTRDLRKRFQHKVYTDEMAMIEFAVDNAVKKIVEEIVGIIRSPKHDCEQKMAILLLALKKLTEE